MKPQHLKLKPFIYGFFVIVLFALFNGCSKDESVGKEEVKNPDFESINDYIKNLAYSINELLGVEETGGAPSVTTETNSEEENTTETGINTTCTTKTYNLKTNFDDIAILKPNSGIIWPGALVKGNASMRNGIPEPFNNISRAPMTLRVENLPGIGEAGNILVEDPKNYNVQTGIDKALEAWNVIADEKGYVNAASQSSEAKISYSSKQLSLELGLNVEWASNSVASQFNYTTSTTKKVAMMSFKQVFYTVVMENVNNPADMFASDVPLSEIENAFNSEAPPAYIASVSYGRIIMFRMETTAKATDAEVIASLKYAAGDNGLDADLYSRYQEVLAKSSITTLVIGGNAEVASEIVSAQNFADLNPIIQGENAIYSRSNPGVPISYTIRYLKDDSLAKLGYTTDYSIVNCNSEGVQHKTVDFINDSNRKFRVGLTYDSKLPDTPSVSYNEIAWKFSQTSGSIKYLQPPVGAYNIELYIEEGSGGNYKDTKHAVLGDVLDNYNTCWRATTNWLGLDLQINKVTCNY